MKKVLVILILFVFILLVAIIGSLLISPNEQVKIVEDILVTQTNLDKNYSCYGYTLDNPKIVVNPYGNSNLSALIMFSTESDVKVSVYLNKKDGSRYKLYEEDEEKKEHYLDIYGLYSNYENIVTLIVDSKKYEYKINTIVDIDFPVTDTEIAEDEIYFQDFNNSLIGINYEHEVVYYLQGFSNKIMQLKNGHLLVSDSRKNNDGSYVSFSEIDMLGRVYNTYVTRNGYKGLVCELSNGNYLVLSDDILQIDRQNGIVLKKFKIDEDDEWLNLEYKEDSNEVILYGKNNTLYYNYDNLDLKDKQDSQNEIKNNIHIENGNYFRMFKQNRFGENKETETNNSNVNLLFYKKLNDSNNIYNIKFKKEFDRIVVNKQGDESIYVILDKFADRRVYKVDSQEFYINDVSLKGKYSIYVKVDDTIYKTNYYVKF